MSRTKSNKWLKSFLINVHFQICVNIIGLPIYYESNGITSRTIQA